MNNYVKLAVNYMRNNKNRTINTICGISLAVALFFGMVTLYMAVKLCNRAVNEWIYGSSELYISDIDGDTYKKLVDDDKVDDILLVSDYLYKEYNQIRLSEEPSNYGMSYCEVGEIKENLMGITLQKGEYPTNSNEIILSYESLRQLPDAQIGDTINVYFEKYEYNQEDTDEDYKNKRKIETREYTLVGIYDVNNVYYETYIGMPGGYSIIDRDNQPAYCEANIKLKNRNNIEKDLKYISEKYGIWVGFNQVGKDYSIEMDEISSLLEYVLLVFAFWFIFVVSVFIIRNSFMISVAERTKDYGILRCIGMSKKQLRGMLVYEGLILSSISIVIGIVISYIGMFSMRIAFDGIVKGLGYGDFFNISLYPRAIVITIIFVAIAVLFCLIEPARVACLITPIEAIRGKKTVAKEKMYRSKNTFLIRNIFGIEGEYAWKNIVRNRGKFISTCIGMALSVLLLVGMSSTQTVVKRIFNMEEIIYDGQIEYIMSIECWGIFYDPNNVDFVDYIEDIQQLNGVKNTTLVYEVIDYAADEKLGKASGKESNIIGMSGYAEPEIEKIKEYLVEGNIDYNSMSEDEVIVRNYSKKTYYDEKGELQEILIKLSDIKVGDTIKLADKKKMEEYIKSHQEMEEGKSKIDDYTQYAKDLVNQGYYNEVTVVAIVSEDDAETRGIYNEQSYVNIVFNRDGYFKHASLGKPYGSKVLFSVDDEYSFDAIKDYVFKQEGISYYDYYDEVRTNFTVLTAITYILYVVVGMILLICMFNMMNNLNSNIVLRKRELETYRIVGMSKKQINKLLIIEGTMAAIIASIIGGILGSVIGYGVYRLLSESMERVYYRLPIGAILISFVLTIGISIVATQSIIKKSKDI